MPGTTIRILSKRTDTFVAASAGTPTLTIVLACNIDVSQCRDLSLAVRFHDGTLNSNGLTVNIYKEGPTPQDPATDFIYTTTPLGTSAFTPSAGQLYPIRVVNTTSFGGFVRIEATITLPATGQTTLAWSADLTMKT